RHFESHAAQARRRDPRGAPQARLAPCPRRFATVGSRQLACLRRFFARTTTCQPLPGALTGTSQISSAYSLIVRSEENQPICAVLRAADCHQACLSRQRRNTERWVSK